MDRSFAYFPEALNARQAIHFTNLLCATKIGESYMSAFRQGGCAKRAHPSMVKKLVPIDVKGSLATLGPSSNAYGLLRYTAARSLGSYSSKFLQMSTPDISLNVICHDFHKLLYAPVFIAWIERGRMRQSSSTFRRSEVFSRLKGRQSVCCPFALPQSAL